MPLKDHLVLPEDYKIFNLFIYLLSAAVITRIISDLLMGRLGIHAGELYPYRALVPMTVYGSPFFFIELALGVIGCIFLVKEKIFIGAFCILISFLMGISQMYQHQKVLFILVSTSLILYSLDCKNKKNLVWFLKLQLALVYFSSALIKVFSPFISGNSLSKTLGYVGTLHSNDFTKAILLKLSEPQCAKFLAISIVIVELLIPLILFKKSFVGVLIVITFHLVMAALIPNILAFSLLMISLSLLFLIKRDLSSKKLLENENNSSIFIVR